MPEIPKIEVELEILRCHNKKLRDDMDVLNVKLTKVEAQVKRYQDKGQEWLKKVDDRKNKEIGELEKTFNQRLSDISKKSESEKKQLEIKTSNLLKQISDFEQLIISERKSFDDERKDFENKNTNLFKEISDKNQTLEKDFERKKKIFEEELSKLNSKLANLSTKIMREQRSKYGFQSKFDKLYSENFKLCDKIQQLEIDNTDLSDKLKSKVSKPDHINTAKSSSVKSVDNNSSHFQKSPTQSSKKTQKVWVIKGSPEAAKLHKANRKKNRASRSKSFAPDFIQSTTHLIQLAKRKLCCSYCYTDMLGTEDSTKCGYYC
ncbi:hypothetical protein L6452_31118 [Arctium lappa]|uniref:Uncharacterized protein n=1 Tax=Arctium lappa TaxID=4217 RepID=A0ACB8ZJ65_ARCLA|nr:hypothetical protein L6452_31118 [Arctium lappa]